MAPPPTSENPRRPTTPMDIRNLDQQQKRQTPLTIANKNTDSDSLLNSSGGSVAFRGMSIRNQQMGEQHQVSNRFNEWDPFGLSRKQQQQQQQQLEQQNLQNERQKSPQKTKPQQQQQSTFAHTFLNTDSSPRQSSGRSQLGSANNQKLQHQISPQHNLGSANPNANNNVNSSQIDVNQSASLELVVSGQKLGGRKEMSPTNTPRDLSQFQPPQSLRPFTRRLQPLEKIALELQIQQQQQNILANTINDGQFLKQKK